MAKEESIFGDLDIESALDDPFNIPDNTYHCFVFSVEVKDTKGGTKPDGTVKEIKRGITINYKIADDSVYNDKLIQEWKHIPKPADPKKPTADEASAASYLKQRLADFGIPTNRMNSVQPDDLIGLEVYVSVAKKNDYLNVRKVSLVTESGVSADPFSR